MILYWATFGAKVPHTCWYQLPKCEFLFLAVVVYMSSSFCKLWWGFFFTISFCDFIGGKIEPRTQSTGSSTIKWCQYMLGTHKLNLNSPPLMLTEILKCILLPVYVTAQVNQCCGFVCRHRYARQLPVPRDKGLYYTSRFSHISLTNSQHNCRVDQPPHGTFHPLDFSPYLDGCPLPLLYFEWDYCPPPPSASGSEKWCSWV